MRTLTRSALGAALLILALRAPLGAQSLGDVPSQYDLTVGAGSGPVALSLGVLRTVVAGTSERLRLGMGLRSTIAIGDVTLTAVPTDRIGDAAARGTLDLASFGATLNLGAHIGWDFTSRLSAGANLDLFGFALGGWRGATYRESATAAPEPRNAKPASIDILGFGMDNQGWLTSELFLSWKATEQFSIRGGLSRVRLEFRSDGPTENIVTRDFEIVSTLLFAGVRWSP